MDCDEFANSAPMNPLLYPDSFMRGVRIDPMQHIEKPPKAASAKEWTVDLGKKTWIALPILLFPVIILGGIYGGYMTPTESAAVGAAYAILAGSEK